MRPLRILLADDHEPTRAGVREMLEAHGMEVVAEAATAAEVAAAATAADAIDVALIEPQLPGGGADAAAALVLGRRARHVVMLAGGKVTNEALFAAIDAGADGYLLKDTDPERLAFAIQGVVDGEAAIPRQLVPRVLAEFRRRGRTGPRQLVPGAQPLSEREWEVLNLFGEGLTTHEVAERVGISGVTVRRHLSSAVGKLGVDGREAAIALVRRNARRP